LPGGRFAVEFYQEGLLRPLSAAELSDGTLRYLLLVAASHAAPADADGAQRARNQPAPDLLPALARLIIRTSLHSQVWVVSHARRLIAALQQDPECNCIVLEKTSARPRWWGNECWINRLGIGRIDRAIKPFVCGVHKGQVGGRVR
jgi:predicted ATPase